MSSSYIDYPLKYRHGVGRETTSNDYNHTPVQTVERSSTVLPEVSKYPNVHMLFRNKVVTTTTNNEDQHVQEDINIGSVPKNRHHKNNKTTPVVRFVEKVEVIDRDQEEDGRGKNDNSEVHEEPTLEQEVDGYLEKTHKGFLSKWKSYKNYY